MSKLAIRERPTLGALAVAFLVSLLNWGVDAIPDSVPGEVVASGYALVALAIAVGVGQLVAKLGRHAPWAVDTHKVAVAYGLSLDPDEHPLYGDAVSDEVRKLGIDSWSEARELLGIDEPTR